MRGYAHSNCKYLRIIKMHDYHESKTVLTINDNHESKAENVLEKQSQSLQAVFLLPDFWVLDRLPRRLSLLRSGELAGATAIGINKFNVAV